MRVFDNEVVILLLVLFKFPRICKHISAHFYVGLVLCFFLHLLLAGSSLLVLCLVFTCCCIFCVFEINFVGHEFTQLSVIVQVIAWKDSALHWHVSGRTLITVYRLTVKCLYSRIILLVSL